MVSHIFQNGYPPFHSTYPHSSRLSHTFPRIITNLPNDVHSSFPGWLSTVLGMINYLLQDEHPAFIKWSLTFTRTQCNKNTFKYQTSSDGGAHSPPATPHRLQNPKWPPVGPKMTMGSGKVYTPRFLGILSNFR